MVVTQICGVPLIPSQTSDVNSKKFWRRSIPAEHCTLTWRRSLWVALCHFPSSRHFMWVLCRMLKQRQWFLKTVNFLFFLIFCRCSTLCSSRSHRAKYSSQGRLHLITHRLVRWPSTNPDRHNVVYYIQSLSFRLLSFSFLSHSSKKYPTTQMHCFAAPVLFHETKSQVVE